MEFYITNIKKDINYKYLLSLRKKTYSDNIKKYSEILDTLIYQFKETPQNTETETIEVVQSDNFQSINQYIFNKPWNKLATVHKIIKIKEYINKTLSISNQDTKIALLDELIQEVKDKKMNKKEHVNYDETRALIVSIPNLKFNNGNYYLH